MTPVAALERVVHCLDRAHDTGFKAKAFVRALDVVRGERDGVVEHHFGMAFLVEADRAQPLVPEPDQPAAWFPIGPEPPGGASARHWARLLAGLRRATGAP